MGYDPYQPLDGQQPPYGQPQPAPPYDATQYGAPPQSGYAQPYSQQPAPNYGQPPLPNYTQPQPPKKGSRRWIWITVIVAGVLVLGCGACIITGVLGIGLIASSVAAPIATTNSYYTAIENQDYATAYKYLDLAQLSVAGVTVPPSQQAFTEAAMNVDQAKGQVTKFAIGSPNINNNTATIIVTVTRNGIPEPVTLTLQKAGNDWKITAFDNI